MQLIDDEYCNLNSVEDFDEDFSSLAEDFSLSAEDDDEIMLSRVRADNKPENKPAAPPAAAPPVVATPVVAKLSVTAVAVSKPTTISSRPRIWRFLKFILAALLALMAFTVVWYFVYWRHAAVYQPPPRFYGLDHSGHVVCQEQHLDTFVPHDLSDKANITSLMARSTPLPHQWTEAVNKVAVFFVGSDYHMHSIECSIDLSACQHADLTHATATPSLATDQGAIAANHTNPEKMSVQYISSVGHLNEFVWDGEWQHREVLAGPGRMASRGVPV
eukprot:TRINITY_DN721_c0_g1_i1.p1 TRINITY_DN721_c0_g1~~TRINITY_DN721_c0_g1_i1.p1  ORF type:complete len:274 (+),score=75.29 TRINITY_DN721_c0_g1_i1:70-891(+)